MQKQRGFTVLELIIVIVFLLVVGTVFLVQRRDLQVSSRDNQSKTAINSIYYNLEEVYYATNNAYPETLTADALKGLDPTILQDPDGVTIGEQDSTYRYEPKDCLDGLCKSYELRADLEAEADFVKESRHQ
ncbi:MAG: type II secretion system protein [Candidatus Woesebacteria bacterium]|jgi:Tfp pilus assembly protein PilE